MSIHTTNQNKVVPEALRNCASIYEERNLLYGDNYKRFGNVIDVLFPNGIELSTVIDYNRHGILIQIISKLMRYCENFSKGGHKDSLDDLSVYSQMLNELDTMLKELNNDSI